MRIHFAIAAGVLIAALAFDVSRLELIALLLAISFVLIAEMLNSAVEAAVDVASTSFDPIGEARQGRRRRGRSHRDGECRRVGYLVFSGEVATRSSEFLDRLSEAPAELTLIALVLTVIVVIALKAASGRGTPLRGGWPSGHAAVAFAGWMATTLALDDYGHRFLISSLTFIMALLVAQTRIESGVHSTGEVAVGGAPRSTHHTRHLPTLLCHMTVTDDDLLAHADAAAARAYAPYSRFHVGCAVLTRDGRVIEGVNVENAAYPLGVCAERTALARGDRRRAPAGRLRRCRDHRFTVRRLSPMARRDARRTSGVSQRRTARDDDCGRAPARAVRAFGSAGVMRVDAHTQAAFGERPMCSDRHRGGTKDRYRSLCCHDRIDPWGGGRRPPAPTKAGLRRGRRGAPDTVGARERR